MKNVDERGRNLMCERTYPSLFVQYKLEKRSLEDQEIKRVTRDERKSGAVTVKHTKLAAPKKLLDLVLHFHIS